ncbi:MAG: type II toxin-antitoxin system VapC family toxin [Bacteroidota bacterium]|nr:type II toxin-antitoxin system VapC family toxin [Bacteroidota bacterium]MDP4232103.1 type II toxin-antitoxin system VapC family toxin [Bacteroidota bacterium]MDP4241189.1 type II toxin-antitoxin system VapC family toxin [Bacteroidota bacterium]MDP4286581.1 type II toxin-antitoxin system VapC family toxin [Bacteroidota bacterium]
MLVVDANILAYLLIEGDRNQAALKLLDRDSDWHSEAFVLTELTNVLVTCIRTNALTLEQSIGVLERAEATLKAKLHFVSHFDALRIANEFGVTAYDARYLVLARKLGLRLVTEDRKLRKAAPALTQSLDDALK